MSQARPVNGDKKLRWQVVTDCPKKKTPGRHQQKQARTFLHEWTTESCYLTGGLPSSSSFRGRAQGPFAIEKAIVTHASPVVAAHASITYCHALPPRVLSLISHLSEFRYYISNCIANVAENKIHASQSRLPQRSVKP
jgi:hypothetical protein